MQCFAASKDIVVGHWIPRERVACHVGSHSSSYHALKRRCAHLHIKNPAMQCRLFNSLVLPTLSYTSK